MGKPQAATENAERHYSTHGLTFVSDVAIPGLYEVEVPGSPAYQVFFRPVTRRATGPASPESGYAVRHEADAVAIRFADGTAAEIDLSRHIVSVASIEGATLEDNAGYLAGPVAGMLARLEGRACFHGAVVVIDGEAHLLCGPSESGKSTTAAAFVREGYAVMSDDIGAVDTSAATPRVLPANPRIHLWSDGASMVFGENHGLPAISPPWEKLYLDLLEADRFEPEPRPLGGVWIFTYGIDEVEALSGSRCLTTLISNAYLPSHGTPDTRRREFEAATEICRTVPIRLLPADLDPTRRVETIVREARSASPRT